MSPSANQKLALLAIDQWEASLVWSSLSSVDHSFIKTRDAALLALSGSIELHWEERPGPGEDLWSITRQLRPALHCHTLQHSWPAISLVKHPLRALWLASRGHFRQHFIYIDWTGQPTTVIFSLIKIREHWHCCAEVLSSYTNYFYAGCTA